MSDIFDVSPPAWLQDLTHSDSKGLLGGALGTIAAGGVIAATKATDENEQRNWFQLLPESITDAKLSLVDPMWKIKLQQTQLGIANTGLQMQQAQQQINANAVKMRLTAEDNANVPKWLQEHPTVASRMDAEWPVAQTREWNENLDHLRLRDSQSTLAKTTVSGLKELSDAVEEISKFDGVKAGELSAKIQPFAVKGQMPPPELTAQVMAARGESEKKKFEQQKELLGIKGVGQPVAQKYLRLADQEDELAEDFRSKGDATNYQAHHERAENYRALAAPKTSTTQITTPSGETITQTFGAPAGAKPTTGTTTSVQQKNIAYSNALRGINDVLTKVRPEDVGIAGVVGENVFDTWVEQFKPGTANRERINNRTALRGLRENLFAALSPERLSGSAFSNRDVERLKELSSNLEASTSYTQFKQRLGEIRNTIQDRIKVNAAALGEPAPDSVKTLPELKTEYESQVSAINKMLTENRLTREQAQERINALVNRIRGATRENFGIDNPFQ